MCVASAGADVNSGIAGSPGQGEHTRPNINNGAESPHQTSAPRARGQPSAGFLLKVLRVGARRDESGADLLVGVCLLLDLVHLVQQFLGKLLLENLVAATTSRL